MHKPVSITDFTSLFHTLSTAADPTVPINALLSKYVECADTRGYIRLLPVDYLSLLSLAKEIDGMVEGADPKRMDSPTTVLIHALLSTIESCGDGSHSAALILSDLIAQADGGEIWPKDRIKPAIVNALLVLVKTPDSLLLDAFSRLLLIYIHAFESAPHQPASPEYTQLAAATISSIVSHNNGNGNSDNGIEALSALLSFLVTLCTSNLRQSTMEALGAHADLRQFHRQLIQHLSSSTASVTAPALAILSDTLLCTRECSNQLAEISQRLWPKLFDESHVGRTMVLLCDLCMRCTTSTPFDENLRVLESIAHVMRLIAQDERLSRRAADALEVVQGIAHIVNLAKCDRRFIEPLLGIVTSSVVGNTKGALLAALSRCSPDDEYSGSVLDDVVDLVVSAVEDAPYTVPPPAAGKCLRLPCDESSAGWINGASGNAARCVAAFLRTALAACDAYADIWSLAVARAIVDSVVFAASEAHGQHRVVAYYWVVRPLLTIVDELCELPVFSNAWSAELSAERKLVKWAANARAQGSWDRLAGDTGTGCAWIYESIVPSIVSLLNCPSACGSPPAELCALSVATPSDSPHHSQLATPSGARDAQQGDVSIATSVSAAMDGRTRSHLGVSDVLLERWADLVTAEFAAAVLGLHPRTSPRTVLAKTHVTARFAEILDTVIALLESTRRAATTWTERMALASRMLAASTAQVKSMEDALAESRTQLEALRNECEENSRLSSVIEMLRSDLGRLEESESMAKRSLEEAVSDGARWKEDSEHTKKQLGDAVEQVEMSGKRADELERRIREIEEKAEAEKRGYLERIEGLEQTNRGIVGDLDEARQGSDVMRAQIEVLKTQSEASEGRCRMLGERIAEYARIARSLHMLSEDID